MLTLSECKAAGIPVFKFGSDALTQMHETAKGRPYTVGHRTEGWDLTNAGWKPVGTYAVQRQEYSWEKNGFQYVVDHGSFHTLNRIECGQVVPYSEDIPND